jgi:hypothetical protein
MKKISRGSFLKTGRTIPATVDVGGVGADGAVLAGTSRRAFLQGTAGAAAGAVAVLAAPKVATVLDAAASGSAEPKAVVTAPSGPAPREPVTAYVHNATRGEVTVMAGTKETTYKDPALVKRLLDASR